MCVGAPLWVARVCAGGGLCVIVRACGCARARGRGRACVRLRLRAGVRARARVRVRAYVSLACASTSVRALTDRAGRRRSASVCWRREREGERRNGVGRMGRGRREEMLIEGIGYVEAEAAQGRRLGWRRCAGTLDVWEHLL